MTDQLLEDRIRRSLMAVADLPMGSLEPRPLPARSRRTVAVVVAAAVVVALLGTVGVYLARRPSTSTQVVAPVQLPVPHGRYQALARSSWVDNTFSGPARKGLLSTTGLVVEGVHFTVQVERWSKRQTTVVVLSNNNPVWVGEGIHARAGEGTDDLGAGRQITTWVGLPAKAAVVTYTYHGQTLWQRPIRGDAAFVHPTVTTWRDTPAGTRHLASHPSFDPLLRAYDASGNLLAENVVYVVGPLTGLSDVPVR